MLRQTFLVRKSSHSNARYFGRVTRSHQYKEFSRWQREASGVTKWAQKMSSRGEPQHRRFFGADVKLAKGTNPEASRWWGQYRYFLPTLPPEGYEAPTPVGKQAWPAAWTDNFAAEVTSLGDDEIREFVLETLTQVIHDETQKDGFELRKLDFEGNPTTELPERKIIEEFLLDEPALKDRVIQQVLEEPFAISPNSDQRREIRDVPNLIRFIQAFINRCRIPGASSSSSSSSNSSSNSLSSSSGLDRTKPVTPPLQDFFASLPEHYQPLFGYDHALPQETRSALQVKWEEQYRHPWQFGHAKFEPKSQESSKLMRGNTTWLKCQSEFDRQENFYQQYVESGQAKKDHMAKIAEAAGSSSSSSSPSSSSSATS